MRELITEEQADQIVLLLSIAVTLTSLGHGFYRSSRAVKSEKKQLWIHGGLFALMGPAIWVFWRYIYNPIEDYYGLDSLKALEINFFIAIGIGAVFSGLFYFVPRWMPGKKVSPPGK